MVILIFQSLFLTFLVGSNSILSESDFFENSYYAQVQYEYPQNTIQSASVEPLIVNASYTNKFLAVTTTNTRSSDFRSDGVRFYILGRGTLSVAEYHLSTPWDIESANYVRELDISPEMGSEIQQSAVPHGLYIKKDGGMLMWVFNRTEIWEYTLSTPWDITTAEVTQYKDLSDFLVRGHDIDFKPDGSVLFIDDRGNEAVVQFNLSTMWDISTLSLDYIYQPAPPPDAFGILATPNARGLELNSNGTRLFVTDSQTMDVLEYYVSDPYDLRSAVYIGAYNVGAESSNPRGITFSPDFRYFYISDATDDRIYQYELPVSMLTTTYRKGWNIAGLPIESTGISYDQLFTNSTQIPFSYVENSYKESTELIPSLGYWLHLSDSETVDFIGEPIANLTINLQEGWNLISGIGYSLPEVAVQDDENIINSGWYGFDGAYFTAVDIEPGYGYWVRASEAGTVTLEHTTSKMLADAKQPLQLFAPEEQFYSLHFISETDTLQTLYFGGELPSEIPATRFVMPPVPPLEAFDARFDNSHGRLAEDVTPQIALQAGGRDVKIYLQAPRWASVESWEILQTENGRLVDRQLLRDGNAIALHSPGVTYIELVPFNETFADGNSDLPNQFALEQNYPNPFNPTTQIKYQLPTTGDVRLDVYDLTGRLVVSLINGQVSAGTHTVTFDAGNLSSGVYIYRIQAGEFQQVRRLTVIK